MKNNKHENNDYLRREFIKNFAIDGQVKWKKYQTNESGVFDINEMIKNEDFERLEKDEKNLIKQGSLVMKKIIDEANNAGEVSLTREELVSFKFLIALSNVKAQELKAADKEEQNELVIKYFNQYKETGSLDLERDLYGSMEVNPFQEEVNDLSGNEKEWNEWTKRNINVHTNTITNLIEMMQSKLIIFKFDEPKLILQEGLKFIEKNEANGMKQTFIPISPSVGIMLCVDPMTPQEQKSKFFESDITKSKIKNIYKNSELIKQKEEEYIKGKEVTTKEEEEYQRRLFLLFEVSNYYDREDVFIFKTLKEKSKIANIWNAKALSQCNSKIVIYQNNEDIEEAEKQI